MASLSGYFSANRPKPKFFLGDRVYGKWNKIPFVGTVAIDHYVSEADGPVVVVFLDLPLKFKKVWYNQISTRQESLKRLK
jgi:hypothetical protein